MAAKSAVQRNIWYILNYLSCHPCVDCGEKDVVVLEFDHITTDKRENISRMVYGGRSLVSIAREVAKCEIRCANCHRRVTHMRRRVDNYEGYKYDIDVGGDDNSGCLHVVCGEPGSRASGVYSPEQCPDIT